MGANVRLFVSVVAGFVVGALVALALRAVADSTVATAVGLFVCVVVAQVTQRRLRRGLVR
jgi:xanthosine utilization system XapX-like protein